MPASGMDPSEMLKNFKELNAWQKPYERCLMIYGITAGFAAEEKYGLTSRIRRSAVSIASNIAEGYAKKTTTGTIRMLYIRKQTLESLNPLRQLNWRRPKNVKRDAIGSDQNNFGRSPGVSAKKGGDACIGMKRQGWVCSTLNQGG